MIAPLALALAQEPYKPYVAPASDEGQAAIARMQVPDGFEVKLWAAEPQLANPVSFCFDAKGDIYVAETFRLKSGVDDIRDHMDWLDDDVACRSVEDRVAYLKKRLGDKFADYSKDSERIRWISDTDGDGRADKDTVFAEGFNEPAAGIAAGLLAWKDKLFYTCMPSLWSLADRNGDHVADERHELSRGYGIRFALIGHDLHGLAIGPDGRLYFSCGDRGLSVKRADGSQLDNQFCGAVLRCNLDGTELEVFATGLRNPQELVFDDNGELFTVDNNSDGGDKARLVHVIEGMDAGWRQSYQWLTEPNLRGPWNDEGLWKPHFDGQAAYIVPPLANICDGPSGLCYEPGTALTPQWRKHFFVCDFRGDRASSGIQTFTLKPKGASFELDTFEHFIWGTLATDCDFGPDGCLYWTDWVEGWGKTGKGRIYRLASTDAIARSLSKNTAALIASDWSKSESERLLELLDYPDLRVRQAAHLELSRRDSDNLGLRFAFAGFPKGTRTLQHFAWSVAARHDAGEFRKWLPPGLGDGGIAMLPQGARMIGDFGLHEYDRELIAAIGSEEPVARSQAAISAGKLHLAPALDALVELARTTGESDPTLRHAAIFGLAGCATAEQLVALKRDVSTDVRVAAVVALRRQKREQVAEFLRDADERVVVEAARAIYDVPIEVAYPQLANLIGQESSKSTALVRRVLHANFRLGGEERAAKLAQFATRADADELHRWEALDLLSKWAEPPGRDGLTGEWWPLAKRDAGFLPRLVNDMRERGIATAPARVLIAWIELAASSGARAEAPHLAALASDTQRDVKVRVAALNAATKLDVHALEPALLDLAIDGEAKVRAAALSAAQALAPERALPLLEQAALQGSIDERRVAFAALAKIDDMRVDRVLALSLDRLRAGLLPPELALDLVEAAEQRHSVPVTQSLEALRAPRQLDASLAPFVDSLYGGERERGRKIFREKAETTCLRCHKIEWGEGGQVGPDLVGVGKRSSRVELLESIVEPNRRLTRGYSGLVLTLDDDTHVAGVVVNESDGRIKLRTAQDELVEVETRRVTNRRADLSAMPQNVSSFLSRDEMRDLIEYLASL